MTAVIQPLHLLVIVLAGWFNRHQQAFIDYLILDVWKALSPRSFPNYPACSQGPEEADELLTRDGFTWKKSQ